MLYVFEGPRNSGKTYLSGIISSNFSIPRFQFNFAEVFDALSLNSKTREAHSFAMGKELMIMQLNKDLGNKMPSLIHDRGILSVLGWGIAEKRISKQQALDQLQYVKNSGLLEGVKIIYIASSLKRERVLKKDAWDFAEKTQEELNAYDFLIPFIQEYVYQFENKFNEESVSALKKLFATDILK